MIRRLPTISRMRRWPQEEPGVRTPLAESRRLFCRPGLGFPGGEFSTRTGAPHLFARSAVRTIRCRKSMGIFWGPRAGGSIVNSSRCVSAPSRILLPPRRPRSRSASTSTCCGKCGPGGEPRAAANPTKTELGDSLVRNVKAGQFSHSDLWCLSRIGARELLLWSINQGSRDYGHALG